MPYDKPKNPEDLQEIFHRRSMEYMASIQAKNVLVDAYHGVTPTAFKDFFHDEMHRHQVNSTRQTTDIFTRLGAKQFSVLCRPRDNTDKAKRSAEKREMIAYGWYDAGRKRGGLDMKGLMTPLTWFQVLTGDAVATVMPDYERETPFYDWRDPRTHYPPLNWSPYSAAPLDGTIFGYRSTIGELCLRYPEKARELYREFGNYVSTPGAGDAARKASIEAMWVTVCEYYSKECWYVVTLEKIVELVRSETGDKGHPGVCPVVPFTIFTPADPKGRSFLYDHLSLQVALERMLSQAIDQVDQAMWGEVFTTPLLGKDMKYGPKAMNVWDPNYAGTHRVEKLSPENSPGFQNTLGVVAGLQRVMNYSPESFAGAGEADSAKALDKLQAGPRSFISDGLWKSYETQLPKLLATTARMDINIWGGTKKSASGSRKNTPFVTAYEPIADLSGFEDEFEVEPGLGLAGWVGKQELLTMQSAGDISRRTAMEQMPDIPNVDEEIRRITVERLEDVQFQVWAARAAEANPSAFSAVTKLMNEDGLSLAEAIEKVGDSMFVQPEQEMPMEPPPSPEQFMSAPAEPSAGPPPHPSQLRGVA